MIAKEDSMLRLAIGGTGPEELYLKRLASDVGQSERVDFLGFIPDRQLRDYYASAEVFLFPSWTTSGITPYEALSVGTKVVWTSEADEPILNDLLVTVAPPTPIDFADAIRTALESEAPDGYIPDLSPYTWDRFFDCATRALLDA